MMTSQSQNM